MPPPGDVAPPVSVEAWKAEVLAREPRVQPAQCLAASWKLLKSNFGLLFGATFLVWLISSVAGMLPFGGVLYWVVRGALYGGLYLVFLNCIRGKAVKVGDVFSGFSGAFAQLMLAGLISSLISGIGFACCFIIPGIYLFVAWTFSVPLVADAGMEFWTAMELSRKVVSRVWFEVFTLLLLAFLPAILMFFFVEAKVSIAMYSAMKDLMNGGRPELKHILEIGYQIAKNNLWLFFISKVVVLLNLPFAVGAVMYAYENLFGTRTPRTSQP
jgi:hypothetical protein